MTDARTTVRLAALLITVAGLAMAQPAGSANLALRHSGAMPMALTSEPAFAYTAGKACDGNPRTGWVAADQAGETWWGLEWRHPVRLETVVLRPLAEAALGAVSLPTAYRLEGRAPGASAWSTLAEASAAALGADGERRHTLAAAFEAAEIRLRVTVEAGRRVGLGEVECLGPEVVLPGEWLPRWQASWIWVEPSLLIAHREPLRRYFRRSFEIADPGQIAEAWLLTCAFDRLNDFWINGEAVAAHPGLHTGSLREAVVVRLDPTRFRAGENVLAASVDDLYAVGSQGLLAELEVVFRDGRRLRLGTDAEWQGQSDQGVVPAWRLPGLSDRRWVPARPGSGPNSRWHWLWNVPRPSVAPEDRFRVTALSLEPSPARPGDTVRVRLRVACDRQPRRGYAAVVLLGQRSFWQNHDHDLGGAALTPAQTGSAAWSPGEHDLELTVTLPEPAPADTPMLIALATPEAGSGLTCDLPGVRADAYGLHLNLPVLRDYPPAPADPVDFPDCRVRTLDGNPTLCIDGEAVPPILWSSSYGSPRRWHAYAQTGLTLFRPLLDGTPVYAAAQRAENEEAWFREADRVLSAAAAVDSRIRLLPAVTMDPDPEWLFDEPSEQMLGGRGSLVIPLAMHVPDRGQVRPTFMSEAWRRDGAAALARWVRHLRQQPYADRVIGICLFAGRAGENYWGGNERNLFFDAAGNYDARPRADWEAGDVSMAARRTFRNFLMERYGTAERLRQAWQRPAVDFDDILDPARLPAAELCDLLCWTDKRPEAGSLRDALAPGVGTLPMDYWQCFAEAMVDSFAAWGRAIKEASDGRLITGCFYGYALSQLYTAVPGFHGHTAVATAARCPDLDFFVSPSEYNEARRAGEPYWGLNINDSLRLHNKLWVYEMDTRTYLAEHMPKTFSRDETLAVMQRDAAAALSKGAAWWWYEFASGQGGAGAREWFLDPAIAELASGLGRLYRDLLSQPERGPSAQIAVFYHGESLTAQDLFPPTATINITAGRFTFLDQMQRLGAPFDLYNLADIPVLQERGLLDQYRLCLFLNSIYLDPTERAWLDLCKGSGRTLVWLWAPGLGGPDRSPDPAHVTTTTGIPGVRWLERRAVQSWRPTAAAHPALEGLRRDQDLTAEPFPAGTTWERFGNEVWPLVHVDARACGDDVQPLGHWVLDGRPAEDMLAVCARTAAAADGTAWTSVLAAVPLLPARLLRNLAAGAGVHLYWDGPEVLFASRHMVALHSGAAPAAGVLRLPRPGTVREALSGAVLAREVTTLPVDLAPFSTAIYRLE